MRIYSIILCLAMLGAGCGDEYMGIAYPTSDKTDFMIIDTYETLADCAAGRQIFRDNVQQRAIDEDNASIAVRFSCEKNCILRNRLVVCDASFFDRIRAKLNGTVYR